MFSRMSLYSTADAPRFDGRSQRCPVHRRARRETITIKDNRVGVQLQTVFQVLLARLQNVQGRPTGCLDRLVLLPGYLGCLGYVGSRRCRSLLGRRNSRPCQRKSHGRSEKVATIHSVAPTAGLRCALSFARPKTLGGEFFRLTSNLSSVRGPSNGTGPKRSTKHRPNASSFQTVGRTHKTFVLCMYEL